MISLDPLIFNSRLVCSLWLCDIVVHLDLLVFICSCAYSSCGLIQRERNACFDQCQMLAPSWLVHLHTQRLSLGLPYNETFYFMSFTLCFRIVSSSPSHFFNFQNFSLFQKLLVFKLHTFFLINLDFVK